MVIPKSELLQKSNRIGVQFLLAEVETGLTFLKVAATTSREEGRARNLQNAGEVYRTVQRLLPRVTPQPEEKRQIESKMVEIREGLLQAGCPVEA